MKGIQFHPEYYEGQQNFQGKISISRIRKTGRTAINTAENYFLQRSNSKT